MKHSEEVLYKKIFTGLYYLAVPTIFIVFQLKGMLGIIGIVGFICATLYMLWNATFLLRTLPGRVPSIALCSGMALVIGSSIIDMAVTVMYSPDLSREGNPIVLMLFDLQAPLWFVYLFELMFNILFMTLVLVLWACFLKSYPKMLETIPYKNFITTFRWIMGAGNISLLDWFLCRKVDFYHMISLVTLMLVMGYFLRLYAALEWLSIIPISIIFPKVAMLSIFSLSTLLFIAFTHFNLKKRNCISAI